MCSPKNRSIRGRRLSKLKTRFRLFGLSSLDKINLKIDRLKNSSTEEVGLVVRAISRALGGVE